MSQQSETTYMLERWERSARAAIRRATDGAA